MKIIGVITEYNPFHNGHLYHITKAKELTQADAVIAIMSGDFVQRGAPALMPKHLRAKVALQSGADVVLELPVCFATGSAEFFACGAVSLLEHMGCVDSICFGSECGDIHKLRQVAHILNQEPQKYQSVLQAELKAGSSFPKARQIALAAYLEDNTYADLLAQPNNILGIEYIRALSKCQSSINTYTITRKGASYHEADLTKDYSSASAIRNFLHSAQTCATDTEADFLSRIKGQVPDSCFQILNDTYHVRYPVCTNDFSILLKHRLLLENAQTLAAYMDVSEELANRIERKKNDFLSFEQFCDLLKTKELTHTRISRALLHILLGIKKEDMRFFADHGASFYARVLGFRKESAQILKECKEHSRIPLLTKLSQTEGISSIGIHMLEQDIFAADLYESVITQKYNTPFINERSQSMIFV